MTATIHGVTHTALGFDVPADACDSHVHVFGPYDRFPLWSGRRYTPGPASVENLLALQRALRLSRVVVVQASPQGTDNACLVDALQRLPAGGSQARGVAVIDEHTTDAELRAMHRAGVRGVRVNLESQGQQDPAVARRQLEQAAARAAPLGWHVQTYTKLPVLVSVADTIRALPVPLVVDHFGHAVAALGPAQPGFDVLLALVREGKAWVKISAGYRISDHPDWTDAGPLARALADANPDRIVWGTDWPHPGAGQAGVRTPDVVEPFFPIDDGRALNRLHEWIADPVRLRKILVDNPARLYDF
jgi:predicted TIM-barrel fold metal-dependent hydrolase